MVDLAIIQLRHRRIPGNRALDVQRLELTGRITISTFYSTGEMKTSLIVVI